MPRKSSGVVKKQDADGRAIPAHASTDLPVKRFFQTIDNDQLEMFLDEHDKYAPFLAALRSAEYQHMTYAKIMQRFNVTLHELNSLYRDGQRNIGLFSMSSHLPKVMEDVSIDAESKMVVCPRCDGELLVKNSEDKPKVCPECDGAGKIRQVGDKHARDLVFESVGLTSQKGPIVAIQQNFGSGRGGDGLNSSLEDTLRMTQTITMGERNEAPE